VAGSCRQARAAGVVADHERQLSGSTESLDVLVVHGNTWRTSVHLRKKCPIGINDFTELLDFPTASCTFW
jgi:hypothetical protein